MKKVKNKFNYQKPVIHLVSVYLDDCLTIGSTGEIHTGWNLSGSENAPKETLWENLWTSPNNDVDL